MKNDCFILATGPSLLTLTDEEKDYIKTCNCLSVNRYLCFYNMIGIEPDSNIYVDEDHKTKPILEESVRNFGHKTINYYTTANNILFLKKEKHNWSLIELQKYNYQTFGESIKDSLFWCSIIGMAINLAYIIYPSKNIKILGMDGGLMSHFWCNDIMENPKKYNNNLKQNLDYSTKNNHQVCNWWPKSNHILQSFFKEKFVTIYNCNKESWFVKNGYIQYKNILE